MSTRSTRQSTLSFGGSRGKISKSSHTALPSKNLKSVSPALVPVARPVTPPSAVEEEKPAVSVPATTPTDENEIAARKISPAALKQFYRKSILTTRSSKPVHQESLSFEEKILRHFDLSSQFGPCIGISRVNRWKRATKLGLGPPVEYLAVALMMEDIKGNTSDEKNRDTRRSYLDDFLSTKTGEE